MSVTELFNIKLNQIKDDPDQYQAFLSNTSTIVKAGPGSGKTTVLTLKIIDLLIRNIKVPRGLACITYSNEAVNEFTARLKNLGYQKRKNVILSTVHSFCISEVIVPFANLYNKDITLPLDIISKKEKNQLFYSILKDFSIEPKQVRVSDMDKERNLNIGDDSEVVVESYDIAGRVATEYENRLREMNKVDFIEIVKLAIELVNEQEYVRKCLEAKFPWVLIDEYQDLGKPLHEMVLTLIKNTNIKFFIVGDPDQSIYGFQGGMPEFLLELYDTNDFTSIELKTNYRSNQEIIDISTIALNLDDREYKAGTRKGEMADIHFVTCNHGMGDQYQYVVNQIIPKCLAEGIPLDEICILASKGDELKELSQVMETNQIPYYFSKQDFLKVPIILWLKDCAAWVLDSTTVSFFELAQFWSKLQMSKLQEEIVADNKKLFSILNESRKYKNKLNDWTSFLKDRLTLFEVIEKNSRYKDDFENLDDFYNMVSNGELCDYNLRRFSQLGKPNEQVTLSTRHSSKGLEFEVVVILGLEEGNFPYYKNVSDEKKLNEERRLFYVCLTRAKRVCYLLRSERMTYDTRRGPWTRVKEPSMFWNELLRAYQVKKTN